MIRIQAIAPFKYEYRGRVLWFTSGESMYLNPSNQDQREELKHILSDKFPFKAYIYVNLDSVEDQLKEEVGQEDGFYKIENYYPLPEEICPVPASFTAPYQEPIDNPFIHPVINSVVGSEVPLIQEVKTEEICELPSEEVIEKEIDRESRLKELNYTAWGKIKDIAEVYGLSYTNKAETINRIIEIEFGD
jgi:hypothetical protein